jgi:hypothetical protein
VCSRFNNHTVLYETDDVCILDSTQAMGDRNCGALLCSLVEGSLNYVLGFRIQRRSDFV